MHLRQVKIAGFKSFADPTVIEFPSGFVGIVGPNGCGKSNVIDAVRWVMGEGRAGELRATSSMQELIFAGADSRAPSGRASVEMVLDNSDGTMQGPWGAYAEISVKRVLTRDGQSSYFINSQPVRRRDVQDIFLGTGLGPRSYAIISQGMVSSFVKARPEELRVYFEEAAGVSRYKERRREAETRLAGTRANLDRVADLQAMREADIERLSGEAEVARRWQELAGRKERFAGIWLALQERDVRNSRDKLQAEIDRAMAEIEEGRSAAAALAKDEAAASVALSEARDFERQKRDDVNRLQLALAKSEGSLTALLERKKRLEESIGRDREKLSRAGQEIAEAESRAAGFESEAERLEEEAAGLEDESAGLAEAADEGRARWEEARDLEKELAAGETEAQRQLSEVSLRQQSLERERSQLRSRIDRLASEKQSEKSPARSELDLARRVMEECAASLEEYEERAALAAEEEAVADEENKENEAKKSQAAERLAGLRARVSALEDMQRKAAAEGKLPGWLRLHGLDSLPALVSGIRVEAGWERAVEAALSARLTAVETASLAKASALESDPPPARFALVDAAKASDGPEPLIVPESLANRIASVRPASFAVARRWLAPFRVAASVEEAVRLSELEPAASFITKEGHTVSRGSVLFWAPENAAAGYLERAGELERLKAEMDEVSSAYQEALGLVTGSASRKEAASREKRDAESALEQARREHHAASVKETRLQADFEAWKQKTGLIDEELAAAEERIAEIEEEAEELEARFEELDIALSDASQKHQDAEMAEEAARTESGEALRARDAAAARVRQLRSDAKHSRDRAEDARAAALRSESAEAEFTAAIEEASAELEEMDEEAGRADVNGLLASHKAAEDAAAAAAAETEKADRALADIGARKQAIAEAEGPKLERAGEMRVKEATLETELGVLAQQIEERHVNRNTALEDAAAGSWNAAAAKREVSKAEKAADDLGPVNHAALESLEASKKALEETRAQASDLEAAIATLEDAIRRIDAETRSVLKSTFDAINANFTDIFRRIFSGGTASLEMTGEEVLESGIEIKAQPPGKRNASVKLLSGGEQALTATALVFAMFRLNPAPFCLLDEIDAPLDEANQTRLAKLIDSMSDATQFVAITHHRITMEFARQLIGVTMREPGVSRVVSVDIREAVRYSSQAGENLPV